MLKETRLEESCGFVLQEVESQDARRCAFRLRHHA